MEKSVKYSKMSKFITLNKLAQWLKANSIMLFNAGSLFATTLVTSLLGFVYWWVAARWFPPESIGIAAAAVSAMTLLGQFCVLGLGTLLIIELPRQLNKAGSMIGTALTVVGVVGACAGYLFAYVAPYVSPAFQTLKANVGNVVIFVIGVSLTAIVLVLDQALIGLLCGGQRLWRNTLFAIAKLAALIAIGFWLSNREGMNIYATWVFGNVVSLGVLAIAGMSKKRWSMKNCLPRWEWLRKLKRQALQHHFLNLTLQAPILILPVLVTVLLSARANAWFYVSWMIAGVISMISFTMATILQPMSSVQPSMLAHKARVTIGIAFVISVLANCVLQLAVPQVLSLFGSSYTVQASWCLHILLLAAFPMIIRDHYMAIHRIHGQMVATLLRMIPGGLLELGVAALGAHLAGLVGLTVGWVAAISIESMFMFRTVYKTVWLEAG